MEWINVLDSLPEKEGMQCLICDSYGSRNIAIYFSNIGFSARDASSFTDIAYWMPLPEPPQE